MTTNQLMYVLAIGALALNLTFTNVAWADKPSSGGGEHGNKHGKKHDRQDAGNEQQENQGRKDRTESRGRDQDGNVSISIRFGEKDRALIADYYQRQANAGHCPPGLAKKNNGCKAPGQAKQWARGKALAKGVEYHDLPSDLRLRLPVPPSGHRYVQVAGDILMIAVGTSIVVDALEDLLR